MSPDDLLVAVLCYSGDVGQVEYQLNWYLHHGAQVLLLSPEDAPACIDHPQIKCASKGVNGWAGRDACLRFREHIRIMLDEPKTWFLVNESDSVCLSAELPEYLFARTDTVWCTKFGSIPEGNYNTPPPWFGHRDMWETALRLMDTRIEEWFAESDRHEGWGHGTGELIAECVFTGEVRGDVYKDSGWNHGESDPSALWAAAERGAAFLTGFKRTSTFDEIIKFWNARPQEEI